MKPQKLTKVGLSFALAQGLMIATVAADAHQTFSKAPAFQKLIQPDSGKEAVGTNCVGGGCLAAPVPSTKVVV